VFAREQSLGSKLPNQLIFLYALGFAAVVYDARLGADDRSGAEFRGPEAKVNILTVHNEVWIKPA
jgi:hypothetical protein